MPEVVEVLKNADFLNKYIKNEYIRDIDIIKGRYKTHSSFPLYQLFKENLPLKVLDIKTKGKFLYIIFDKNFYLFCTLGLKGGWTIKIDDIFRFPCYYDYVDNKNITPKRKIALNNLNVSFKINKNKIVYFFDSLSFGTLKISNNEEILKKKLLSLGPDIMHVPINIFKERLLQKNNLNKEIGNVLMNQKIISGIGNYLRSDILWLSKISPFRLVKDLSNTDIKKIFNSAKILTWGDYDMNTAIKLNYINSSFNIRPQNYNRNYFIYNYKTDIHGYEVKLDKLYEGSVPRTIHWVPEIQK